MLLENYLNNRLTLRTVAIFFSLTIAVLTQGIVSLLHEIEWDYIRVSELLILTFKESLPSIPIVLNLSLVIAWISLKKELYQKKEVHALWLSGWSPSATMHLILSSLLKISICNIFILYILAPSIRDLGPKKNTGWIQALSNQFIPHSFAISTTQNTILIGEGLADHKISRPLFVEFRDQWSVLRGDHAQVNSRTIDFVGLQSILAPADISHFTIKTMSIPILEKPLIVSKEFHSLSELLHIGTPKMIGEAIWRFCLIILPWCVLLPFRSLAPNLQYRKEGTGELSRCLFWFSTLLVLFFLGSKLPVIL